MLPKIHHQGKLYIGLLPFQLKDLNEQLSLLSLYKVTADSTIAEQDSIIVGLGQVVEDLFLAVDIKDQIIVNNEITIQNMTTMNGNTKKRMRRVVFYTGIGCAAGGALLTTLLMR